MALKDADPEEVVWPRFSTVEVSLSGLKR